jgi:citrate lyase alpha subunit
MLYISEPTTIFRGPAAGACSIAAAALAMSMLATPVITARIARLVRFIVLSSTDCRTFAPPYQ